MEQAVGDRAQRRVGAQGPPLGIDQALEQGDIVFTGLVGDIDRRAVGGAHGGVERGIGIGRFEHVEIGEDQLAEIEGVIHGLQDVGGSVALLQVVAFAGLVRKIILDRTRYRGASEIQEGIVGHVHAVDDGVVEVPLAPLVDGAVQRLGQVPHGIVSGRHAFGNQLIVDLDQGEARLAQPGVIGVEIGVEDSGIGLQETVGHRLSRRVDRRRRLCPGKQPALQGLAQRAVRIDAVPIGVEGVPQADVFQAAPLQAIDHRLEPAGKFHRVRRPGLQPAVARLEVAVVEHHRADRRPRRADRVDLGDHPIGCQVMAQVRCVPGVPAQPGQGFGQGLFRTQILGRPQGRHGVFEDGAHRHIKIGAKADRHLGQGPVGDGGAQRPADGDQFASLAAQRGAKAPAAQRHGHRIAAIVIVPIGTLHVVGFQVTRRRHGHRLGPSFPWRIAPESDALAETRNGGKAQTEAHRPGHGRRLGLETEDMAAVTTDAIND